MLQWIRFSSYAYQPEQDHPVLRDLVVDFISIVIAGGINIVCIIESAFGTDVVDDSPFCFASVTRVCNLHL